jgi:flavin-binding protein dodecin
MPRSIDQVLNLAAGRRLGDRRTGEQQDHGRCAGTGIPSVTAATGGMPSLSSRESVMSVYRVTEIIGTSGTSWEEAAAEAIRTAAGTIRDLRVAEVVKQDIHLDEDGAITYRTKLQLSFKYEHEH